MTARFAIIFDSLEIASFAEFRGFHPAVTLERPGGPVTTPPYVQLRHGLSGTAQVFQWYTAAKSNPSAARRSGKLQFFSPEGLPSTTYWLEKAWPSRLEVVGGNIDDPNAVMDIVDFSFQSYQQLS
ncbi:hypothetical protein JMUB6875_62230 [Nocardia sp. JMUB6875]|uniref:hypothetical protein n=1 Tax=Nocardia sp. JMUB6875 TaxID=3158170 RepID=UPI0032E5712B